MDTAVALVRAYLNVNGYFTVVEYPVLESERDGHARSVTDLDVLAVRFPGAGHEVVRGRGHGPIGDHVFEPDPVLGCPSDRPDMIVGEVKEGAARFNAATRNRAVLEVALARFGCCPPMHAGNLARRLVADGRVESASGHAVRMVAFGSSREGDTAERWTVVPMSHVVAFLRTYIREHWAMLHHAQIKDPALGVLALLEKWSDGQAGA